MTCLIDEIIEREFADSNCSDLHLTTWNGAWKRTSGYLMQMDSEEISVATLLEFFDAHAVEIGFAANGLEKRLSPRGDTDFSCTAGGYRVRGNVFKSRAQLTLALRVLKDKATDFYDLGLPEKVVQMASQSKGLLLVTGPTGSGKSSTLASVVDYLNSTSRRHILTIEDPVEFLLPSSYCLIQQRQVGRDANSFAEALRAAMREDPDVIMVGEMRDRETVETALNAANTGHLVLATLHTMSARQSVERILSFFAADERDWAQSMLSSVLLGSLSQVLVPRADGFGRQLCYELMVNTPAVRTAIKDGKMAHIFTAMDTGSRDGQVLLNANLLERVHSGTITAEEACYVAYDPKRLEQELTGGY